MSTPVPAKPLSLPFSTHRLSAQRLVSLDVFRGITITAMILVNNPGSEGNVFAPLRHAAWNGWTLADLVFPSFIYIAGTALVLSSARRAQKLPQTAIYIHILWRSLALIAIGLLLNGLFYLPWENVRLPGVLQRIGLVYLFTALIVLTTSWRVRVLLAVTILVGYWGLLAFMAAPGSHAGDLSPRGNLVSYVDRQIFGIHIWLRYRDPEGVLSTFQAVATALLGTLAGDLLLAGRKSSSITVGLILAGITGIVFGQVWNVVFPINKNLWTSSFVLLSAGIASVGQGLCYWVLEVKEWRGLVYPFKLVGMNPLALYIGSEVIGMSALDNARSWVFANLLAPVTGPTVASLLWGLAYAGFWGVMAYALYRMAIFIRL
jgi:predicted acyltransferase